MTRFPVAIFLLGAAVADAEASSLMVLGPAKDAVGPSMVVLDAPSPATSDGAAARSIVAVGQSEPPVSDEKLSSISAEPAVPHRGPATAPMVIRGGIVGDAFVRSAPPPVTEPRQVATGAAPTPSHAETNTPLVGPSAESELNLQ